MWISSVSVGFVTCPLGTKTFSVVLVKFTCILMLLLVLTCTTPCSIAKFTKNTPSKKEMRVMIISENDVSDLLRTVA